VLLRPPTLALVAAALLPAALPPAAFGACAQTNITSSYISSWDSYGTLNTYSIEESRYLDKFAGKGPYRDRHSAYTDPGRLMLSYNVLGFQIPPLTGPVVSAELRLQIRYWLASAGVRFTNAGR